MKIGIIGLGVIGYALKNYIETKHTDVEFLIQDPPKGFCDSLTEADIIFISIHIPTNESLQQDLTLLKSIIKSLPDKPIFIRTTLLPGTCDALSKEFNKKIYFMPEFLTERSAIQDFYHQNMIFTGEIALLQRLFPDKRYLVMSNFEAELCKYAHNVFGALKVTYFNGIYSLCQKYNLNYENVRLGCLLSGYINDTHTFVPGPDGKLGYGGKCFPKDVDAFWAFTKGEGINKLIEDVHIINQKIREK